MVKRKLVIKDNIVVNIIEADDNFRLDGFEVINYVEGVEIGDVRKGKTFERLQEGEVEREFSDKEKAMLESVKDEPSTSPLRLVVESFLGIKTLSDVEETLGLSEGKQEERR